MKSKNEQLPYFLVAGLLLLPNTKGEFYLDPGSGSFILQVLIAAGAGAIYMLRTQLGNLFSFGSKKKTDTKPTPVKKTPTKKSSPAKKKGVAKKSSKAKSAKRNAR